MGKQSARLYFQGQDHKDIYFQGCYHDKMYKGSELIWEKLHGDKYFVTKIRDEIFVFYIDSKTFKQSNNAYVDDVAMGNGVLSFLGGRNIYISEDGIYWNKTSFIAPENIGSIPVEDLGINIGNSGSQVYAYIFNERDIIGIAIISIDGTCNQYTPNTIFDPNPSGSLTSLSYAIKDCDGIYPERVLERFFVVNNSAYYDAYIHIGKIDNDSIVYYGETFLTYEKAIYFVFFFNNNVYCYGENIVEYASIGSGFGTVNRKDISLSLYHFESKEVFFIGNKVFVYGIEEDENLNPIPILLETTDYFNFAKTVLPTSISVKELNSNSTIEISLISGQGNYYFVFGTIKEAAYFENGQSADTEHIGIGIRRTSDTYITGFAYIDNLYFNESNNNVCWLFK